MTHPQDNSVPKEERSLEAYHIEAMIKAEVDKRLAAEKLAQASSPQPHYPPAYYESPSQQQLAQQQNHGFPSPTHHPAAGTFQPQPYYPNQNQPQSQGFQTSPIPYQQSYQPPTYYQQQPQAQPVINVVVNTNNVNQNVNHNGYGHYGHGHIGLANLVYFLLFGWCLGLTWGFLALIATLFNAKLGSEMLRQALFLAFLV